MVITRKKFYSRLIKINKKGIFLTEVRERINKSAFSSDSKRREFSVEFDPGVRGHCCECGS